MLSLPPFLLLPLMTLLKPTQILLFCALATLSACAQQSIEPEDTPVPACTDDSGCAEGLTCQAERCVDQAMEPLSVALQVSLPDSVNQLPHQVTGVLFEPGLSMPDFRPEDLVNTRVSVTRRTEVIPADVRFRAARAIPGTTVDIWVQTGMQGGVVPLLPGEYDVLVSPTGSSLPTRRFRGVQVTKGQAGDDEVRVDLPIVQSEVGERLVNVRGTVKLNYLGEAGEVPGENVTVQARSTDGEYKSQPYTTCVDDELCDGSFELILPPQTADQERTYELTVEPTEDNDTIPRIVLAEFVVGSDSFEVEEGDTIILDLGIRIADGIPPFTTLTGTITGGPEMLPVEGALVGAQGELAEGIEFNSSAVSRTDARGYFEVRVPELAPESSLSLQVSPPESSSWASQTFESVDEEALEFNLPTKPLISGTVTARSPDEVVNKALITATPVVEVNEATVSTIKETSSNKDGAYELALEPGTYDITIQPPVSSALPLNTERIVVQPDQEMKRDVALGKTSVVFGRVMADLDVPIEGARVEVFAHDIEAKAAVKIGSAQTDEEGVYRVIVPNPDQFDFFGLSPQ